MTERPILFSGSMVRAILDGSKTQTRRPLRIQPPGDTGQYRYVDNRKAWFHESMTWRLGDVFPGSQDPDQSVAWVAAHGARCPFGAPGDRLWVRETWRPSVAGSWPMDGENIAVTYAADGAKFSFQAMVTELWAWPHAAARGNLPSIHMPRWASRITLEVLDVRVQRLQDISEEDARAEGIEAAPGGRWFGASRAMRGRVFKGIDVAITYPTAREAFADLWSATYGAESWAANPWTWAITFRRVEVTPPDPTAR